MANRFGNAVLDAIRIIEEIDDVLDLRRMYRINDVMESYYADMEMILSNIDGGQLYMHIPMKPENTPGF